MPKFKVNVSFELRTEIEPEGIRFDNFDLPEGAVEDDAVEDDSYFTRQDVECDGGSVNFTVEASDETFAEQAVASVIFDGCEVEDDSGLTWLLDSVRYEVEEVEDEMTVEKAKDIIRVWITAVPRTGVDGDLMPSEVRTALLFLLDQIG